MEFRNKHILVTGGAKGIGAACVEGYRAQGARVTIFDRDAGDSDDTQLSLAVDVSRDGLVKEGVAEAIRRFGDIDVLVNNAGIQRYGTVTSTPEEVWDEVMNVNLKSAYLCARHVIPSMQRCAYGAIINVASVQAFVSQEQVAAYTTSKSALLGLTRSIAVDFAPKIRCVAVCPGTIDTPMLRDAIKESPDPEAVYQECVDMHPIGKIGSPTEVAELIMFLSSARASFITGQAYRIDGGLGIHIGGSKRD